MDIRTGRLADKRLLSADSSIKSSTQPPQITYFAHSIMQPRTNVHRCTCMCVSLFFSSSLSFSLCLSLSLSLCLSASLSLSIQSVHIYIYNICTQTCIYTYAYTHTHTSDCVLACCGTNLVYSATALASRVNGFLDDPEGKNRISSSVQSCI